jgi:hypothetical protein
MSFPRTLAMLTPAVGMISSANSIFFTGAVFLLENILNGDTHYPGQPKGQQGVGKISA